LVIFNNEIKLQRDTGDEYYYYCVAKDYAWSFVGLRSKIETDDEDKPHYLHHEAIDASALPGDLLANMTEVVDNLLLFRIKLDDALSDSFIVQEYHKGRREPFPKVIRVYEKQKVEVFDSKYFLSVYPTKQSTIVFSAKYKDIHYKSHEEDKKTSDTLQYGPYSDIAPVTFEQISLMFTFMYPLPTFTKANRDIFVSHWGSIAIDEYFAIFNAGAGINGQFSRVDYQPHINPNQGANAISSLGTELPQYITGLYYYDYIGNISTSHAQRLDDHVEFTIQPRFPIFGQWKTDWNQGYNMPTEKHLFQSPVDPNEYTLEVDYMHAWDRSLVEDYTVRVILPEGATNIRLELPFQVTGADITLEKYYGTLDYFGRPTLKIQKPNAVHDICNGLVRVKYQFDNQKMIYLEPLQLTALIFVLFIAMIVVSRTQFNLYATKQKK